jgi:hypothetical protein
MSYSPLTSSQGFGFTTPEGRMQPKRTLALHAFSLYSLKLPARCLVCTHSKAGIARTTPQHFKSRIGSMSTGVRLVIDGKRRLTLRYPSSDRASEKFTWRC